MADIHHQLRDLGGPEHPLRGGIISGVRRSHEFTDAAAEVVLAMANQIGDYRVRSDTAYDGALRDHGAMAEYLERERAIYDLAGRLGLDFALRTVVHEPVVEGGREITPPEDMAEDPLKVAVQLAILTEVDEASASASMPGRRKLLTVHTGGTGIDSALDDFDDL